MPFYCLHLQRDWSSQEDMVLVLVHLWKYSSVTEAYAACPCYLITEESTPSLASPPVEVRALQLVTPAPHTAMVSGPLLTISTRPENIMSVGTLQAAWCCLEEATVRGQQVFCPPRPPPPLVTSLNCLMTQGNSDQIRQSRHYIIMILIYYIFICSPDIYDISPENS